MFMVIILRCLSTNLSGLIWLSHPLLFAFGQADSTASKLDLNYCCRFFDCRVWTEVSSIIKHLGKKAYDYA